MTPDICPNCGEVVPPKAKACPECGSDEKTGWSDDARADQLGIPTENFDYNEYIRREFEEEKQQGNRKTLWIITAAVLVLLFVWFVVAPYFRGR